jgi:hypothetical protein
METVLVCTIARNASKVFGQFYRQLRESVTTTPGYTFLFSIYENDSTDDTAKLIRQADWSFFPEHTIKTETVGTAVLTGKNAKRVENLAKARNACIEAGDFLSRADWVLFVETDVEYTPSDFRNILKHADQDVDVFSGVTVCKDTRVPYDTWATRHTSLSKGGDGFMGTGLKEFWATFSCLCLYKAEPFKKGLRFHWMNTRLGIPDCDTTVICEIFRQNGYSKILVDQDINPTHYLENLVMYAIHPGPDAEKLANFIRKCAREHDDVVITDKVIPTREYVFQLNADEIPHVYLIKCMDNNILRTKPRSVHINVMNLDLGNPFPTQLAENGATVWPEYSPRLYMRNPEDGSEPIRLAPTGVLSIWKVKLVDI